MALFTKSVQQKSKKQDGIRICIMRRIKSEHVFDMWIPTLAPSTKLLKEYHERTIDWQEYEKRFTKEVLETQTKYLEIVGDIAKRHDVTLLCWEETPEMCHRRLVAECIKNMYPEIILQHS